VLFLRNRLKKTIDITENAWYNDSIVRKESDMPARTLSPKIPECVRNVLRGAYAIQLGEEMRFEIIDEEDAEFSVKMRFCLEQDNLFEVVNA
jgi:hypothetical protein